MAFLIPWQVLLLYDESGALWLQMCLLNDRVDVDVADAAVVTLCRSRGRCSWTVCTKICMMLTCCRCGVGRFDRVAELTVNAVCFVPRKTVNVHLPCWYVIAVEYTLTCTNVKNVLLIYSAPFLRV